MSKELSAAPRCVVLKDVTHFSNLAGESGRAGVGVGRRDRVVDVDQDAGVLGGVRPREGSQFRRRGAPTTGDNQLPARQIELCGALALRHVQCDVLVAHQVVASRNALRDGNGDGGLAYAGVNTKSWSDGLVSLSLFSLTIRGPRQLAAKRGLLCVDPEPHGSGGVPGVDVLTSGDFGQVGLEGTRVVDVRGDADAH